MNAGRPGHDPGHRPLRGIPRSRAYWELKAEQMMNRLFEPEAPVEVETAPAPEPPGAGNTPTSTAPAAAPAAVAPAGVPRAAGAPAPPPRPQVGAPEPEKAIAPTAAGKPQLPWLLVAGLGGMGLVAALVSALYLSQWTRLQQALTQERNLLLLERLRNFGPASPASAPPAPVTPPAPILPPPANAPQAGVAGAEGLPPPPPEEPWMQQLSQLPGGASAPPAASPAAPRNAASGAPVLRVPVSPALANAARRPRPAPASGPTPVLVGVVAAPGRAASAIFQVGNLSTSAGVGETISGTSWRLRTAGADTAVIERDGEQRTLSIGNGG